jgi:serine/threonine protein kinase
MRYDGRVSAFQPGDVIGRRYRLIQLLGSGAMGVVWSARNEAIDRSFAIKLMRPDATANPSRVQRFFREAKAAGRLRHRSIIEVYDLGVIEQLEGEPRDPHTGTPYLVMELLEGEPLDGLLRRTGKLAVGTALRLVAEVARGLHVAHKHGIIHRDLKPGNLFLHRSPEDDRIIEPKILDFGVSKLLDKIDSSETTEGTILGSPAYMSPEQTWGEADLDGRADVWSLGVVLYKALSAALPFEGSNFHAIMMAINSRPAQPLRSRAPELPSEVCALVHRCLEKEREARHPSAIGLADAIDALLATHRYPEVDLAPLLAHQSTREISRVGTLPRASTLTSATRPIGKSPSGTIPIALAITGGSPTVRLVESTRPLARSGGFTTIATQRDSTTLKIDDGETITHERPPIAAQAADDSAEGSAQIAAIARPRATRASTSFVIAALSLLTVGLTAALILKKGPSTAAAPVGMPAPSPVNVNGSETAPATGTATATATGAAISSATSTAAVTATATAPVTATTTAPSTIAIKSPVAKKKLQPPGAKPTVDPAHEGVLRAGF